MNDPLFPGYSGFIVLNFKLYMRRWKFFVVVLFKLFESRGQEEGSGLLPIKYFFKIRLLRIYMTGICCVQDTEIILKESLNKKFSGNRIMKQG